MLTAFIFCLGLAFGQGQSIGISIEEDTVKIYGWMLAKVNLCITNNTQETANLVFRTHEYADCIEQFCCQTDSAEVNLGFEIRDSDGQAVELNPISGDLWPKYKVKLKKVKVNPGEQKEVKLKVNMFFYSDIVPNLPNVYLFHPQ